MKFMTVTLISQFPGLVTSETSAVFWFAALLIGTLITVLLMLAWLMLLNRLHERAVRREARVRREYGGYFLIWLFRDPLDSEIERISRLSARDYPIFLRLCVEQVSLIRGEFKERLGEVLKRSGLFGREIRKLSRGRWWLRADACRNLGRLGLSEAVPHLIGRLGDAHPTVRISAIIALSNLRASEAVEPMIRALERFGGWADMRAIMAFQKMGPEIIEHLEPLLQTALSQAALKAVLQIIGQIGTARNPALIRRLAFHPDPEIRVDAVRALSRIEPDNESVQVCVATLSDAEWPVRAIAAQSLGLLGDRSAIPHLEAAMSDAQFWVRHHAAEALTRTGEAGLCSLERQSASRDPFVRDMAEQMLFMQRRLAGQTH